MTDDSPAFESQAEFFDAVERGDDLSGTDLRSIDPFLADLGGLDLTGADLSRADDPATITGERYPRALLDEVHVRRSRVRASKATLDSARLNRIRGVDADFSGASLRGATFTDADLTGADFTQADLSGADLSGAVLDGARLLAARWDETTVWPDGFTPTR